MSAAFSSSFDSELRERAIAEATAPLPARMRAGAGRVGRALGAVPAWARAAIAAVAALLVMSALLPAAAEAVPANYDDLPDLGFLDIGGLLQYIEWWIVYGIFGALANGLLTAAISIIDIWTYDSVLTSGFYEMLGMGASGSVGTLAVTVADTIIRPCAYTILGMVMLLQLVEVARRMDQQGGTLPAVREVLVLFFFYTVFIYVVGNASGIMQGIFWLAQQITGAVNNLLLDSSGMITADPIAFPDDMGLTEMGVMVLACFIAFIVSFLLALIGSAMGIMRALEVYLFTMFSPLPFAFLGFEATRQWGIGFIKEFLATCLSGTILVVIMFLTPYLVSGMAGDLSTGSLDEMIPNLLGWAVRFIAVELCIIISITKSGRLARSILGG